MPEETTRVVFDAPASLVERADVIADLLDVSRSQLLVDALRDELDELATDEGFRYRLADAYDDGRVGFDDVESILGTEEALRMRLLHASLSREPPEPRIESELLTESEFYGSEIPEWTPAETAGDDTRT